MLNEFTGFPESPRGKITVQNVGAVTNARNFGNDPAPDEQPEQPDEQCDPVEVNFVGNDCIILKPNVLKTKLPGLERYCDLRVFVPMSSDRIIVDAIKVAQPMPRLCCDSANSSVRRRYDRSWSAAATHSSRLHCEHSSGSLAPIRRLIGRP